MTVSLQNPGLIPIEAVTTMGVSVKEGDNPIGFFGTGLKYAIASLLRTGQSITIYRGLEKFSFWAETGTVRGKDFEFVVMNGERLGFTTHLGAHWEPWQVFRELYSNLLDEQGEMAFTRKKPGEGKTTIVVDGEVFEATARDKNKYFLSTKAVYANEIVSVHPGVSSQVFYRGVAVGKLKEPSAFTYNFTTAMTLTEDRTLKDGWYVSYYVGSMLSSCKDPKVLEAALRNTKGFEKGVSFSSVSEDFANLVFRLVEEEGVTVVTTEAIRAAEEFNERELRVKELTLTLSDQRELAEARAFLKEVGYEVLAQVIVAENLGRGVFGMARNGKIYLSQTTLTRGGNFLIGTLLEEHLHLSQGFLDESRSFQDFLIDLVVKFAKDAQWARANA